MKTYEPAHHWWLVGPSNFTIQQKLGSSKLSPPTVQSLSREIGWWEPASMSPATVGATMDPIRLGYRELFRVWVFMEPVRFGYTEFSVPVTTSLLASIFLPPQHFWIAFCIIICLRGWVDVIWNQLKATTVAIICTTQQEVQPETEPAAAQFQMVAIVGDEHSQQEQSTSDGDFVIEIGEQP
ncbi:hypothetical protein F0562_012555 [Nyssa sinensis]|uniref:Uncharacterized protein n=1 Tax=Nyssa sinensis TaxID=561372 RepID=A0A5J4ZYK2_9ASTE|nr:hypothetical protein F0562_012555 [Nyssa sinensis]